MTPSSYIPYRPAPLRVIRCTECGLMFYDPEKVATHPASCTALNRRRSMSQHPASGPHQITDTQSQEIVNLDDEIGWAW